MILIPFLDIAAVLRSLRFTRPPRTGDDGVDFAFEYQVCIILHNFAIFYDFDTFSRHRGCIALISFHSSPEDGGRWGRRWEKTLRVNIRFV